jgi:two-component system response regulator AlgR
MSLPAMRILIVDDEEAARRRLRGLLAEIGPNFAVAGEAADGIEALRHIAAGKPDAVLLDIRMPRLDGLGTAREIAHLPEPPAVIFATAHDEFALEAFELAAVDYLLKPIRRERLETALGRASRFGPGQWQRLDAALPAERRGRSHLCAFAHGELRLISVAAVIYFRAESKYTTVRTEDSEAIIEDSLVVLEQEFGENFVRIHRNALVARNRIAGLVHRPDRTYAIRLHGIADSLEVSRRHLPGLRARLRALSNARELG